MDELTNEVYFEEINELFKSDNDPNGSYTGTNSVDPLSEPVQDADDL